MYNFATVLLSLRELGEGNLKLQLLITFKIINIMIDCFCNNKTKQLIENRNVH